MNTILRVPDASCGHCKETIEGAVSSLAGVRAAELDLDSKELRVEHDDVASESLFASVVGAGYTPEEV